ncbi:MAG: AbrB/MazE/SpoVT family DNA-binding domain-containing protein [Oscillospiraceae bacterium]|jgi:transcriptional pleiotropic regulator of transition state genes|nr:AbrB/MazE/SpoVT family DNA-binding domain-containing protein [Oscillospiraceae bacterium]
MKSAFCDCKIDALGRMVLPKPIRNSFHLAEGDRLDIFFDDDKIVLKKHIEGCYFCGEAEHLQTFKSVAICKNCLAALKEI